jgi:hypothetical protein
MGTSRAARGLPRPDESTHEFPLDLRRNGVYIDSVAIQERSGVLDLVNPVQHTKSLAQNPILFARKIDGTVADNDIDRAIGKRDLFDLTFQELNVVDIRFALVFRMALGAAHNDVLRMVLKDGARMTVLGIGIGIATALGLTRLMSSMLFGVNPTDLATFAVVALTLSSIAMLACYLPAEEQ